MKPVQNVNLALSALGAKLFSIGACLGGEAENEFDSAFPTAL
jgi:hypothetical protein